MREKEFSLAAIGLIKGIVYRAEEPLIWEYINKNISSLEEYFEKIGLEIFIDDGDGYAYLKSSESDLPKLARIQRLSFKVSFLLAVLRGEAARKESEDEGDVVLSKEDIVDKFTSVLTEYNDEAKILKEVDSAVNKVLEMGFLKRLPDGGYKIQPIIKSFINANWLNEFDKKIQEYEKLLKERGL